MAQPTPTSDQAGSPASREGRKGVLFKAIGGRIQNKYPTKYLWDFYHDKHSMTADYGERLTLYNEQPIDNWMTFMQYYNNFPFTSLRMKDAAHFCKHTVKPMWEDARNQDGGAWYFRIPEGQLASSPDQSGEEPLALEFFQQVLLAAVGDDFAEVIQPRDDLCGVSITKRWKAYVVMIWTRRGEQTKSIDGIKEAILSQAPDDIKQVLLNEKNCYYKKHRDHAGFDETLARTSMQEYEARKAENDLVSPEDQKPSHFGGRPF